MKQQMNLPFAESYADISTISNQTRNKFTIYAKLYMSKGQNILQYF